MRPSLLASLLWHLLVLPVWAKTWEKTTTYSTVFCSTEYDTTPTSKIPRTTTLFITRSHTTVKGTGTQTVTSTVTPPTSTTTSTITVTSTTTTTSTLAPLTQTFTTTTTSTTTSTTSITTTQTTTSTSTSTVTSTTDVIVPTASGFTAVGDQYPRKIRREALPTPIAGYKPLQPDDARVIEMRAAAKNYPTRIDCTATRTIVTMTYSAATTTTTTVTAGTTPTTTAYTTTTSMITSTTTVAGLMASTTLTSTTTTTVTSRTTTTSTITQTTTTTSTSFVPGATGYAVCMDADNYLDTYMGQVIYSVYAPQGGEMLMADSAMECCNLCQASSTCGVSLFLEGSAREMGCYSVFISSTCNATMETAQFFAGDGYDDFQIKISNGNCGKWVPGTPVS